MEKVFLNIGSDLKKKVEYINIDYSSIVEPDVVCNIAEEKLPFNDNLVSGIIAHHILEHIPINKLSHVLEEYFRVLISGGWVDIRVPSLTSLQAIYIDPTHYRGFSVRTFQYFDKSTGGYADYYSKANFN